MVEYRSGGRNSQMAIFASFVLFAIFWILYILSTRAYQFGLLSWDLASNIPNYAFIGTVIRNVGLLAIFATLLGLGSGVFLSAAIKQAITRDKRNMPPFVCILISLLVLILPIGMYIAEAITLVSLMWEHLAKFTGLVFAISLFLYIVSPSQPFSPAFPSGVASQRSAN